MLLSSNREGFPLYLSLTIGVKRGDFQWLCIPVGMPTRENDFIVLHIAESSFKVERHEVIEEHFASDHLPVFVEVVFSAKE